MSKRKCDEFRDPDYGQSVQIKTEPLEYTAKEKLEKIKSIIRREFLNEITQKHESLTLIDERLLEARKIFHRLRYAIVNNFYNNKKFDLTDNDVHKEVALQNDPIVKSEVYTLLTNDQKRIHPSIKETLMKNNEDTQFSPHRPQRKRTKQISSSQNITTIVDSNTDSLRTIKLETNKSNHEGKESSDHNHSNVKIPMYIEPKISEENVLKIDTGRTNKQKQKFRIIIGNTSKYVEPHSSHDRVTHRWLLYVRGPPSSPDISHILEYVTVQLHDSYIPHNIIKIRSPPFHLSRRGWGEFPVKLRLHFKNDQLNKPINIVHNLKLDRLHTGLQTLGGETVVDVWLYTFDTLNTNNSSSEMANSIFNIEEENCENVKDEFCQKIKEELEDVENNLFGDELKIKDEPMELEEENIDPYDEFSEINELHDQLFNGDDKICDTLLNSANMFKSNLKLTPITNNTNNIQKLFANNFLNDHDYCSNVSDETPESENQQYSDIETTVIKKLHKIVSLHQIVKWFSSFDIEFNKMLNLDKIIKMNRSIIDKISILSDIDQNKMLNIENITTMNKIIISNYVKELSALLWNKKDEDIKNVVDVLQNFHAINDAYFNMELLSKKSLKADFNLDRKKSECMADALAVVDRLMKMPKVVDVRCLVNLMVKMMPIVNESANSAEFQQLFPFAVKSCDKFFSMNVIKRRNLQWTRAKMIKCFLDKKFGANSTWTTKQIVVFSLYHGYYPVKENHNLTDNTHMEKSDPSETFNKPSEINTKTLSVYNIDKFEAKNDQNDEISNSYSKADNFCYISDSSDDEIDICDDKNDFYKTKKETEETTHKLHLNFDFLPFENNFVKSQCEFVENECSKVGVVLRNQNVGHGYVHGVAHKMILATVKCLVEDILRRALSVKHSAINHHEESVKNDINNLDSEDLLESKFQECASKKDVNLKDLAAGGKIWKMSEAATVTTVSLKHIFEALKTRKEFDIFTNFGLGSEPSEFQGDL